MSEPTFSPDGKWMWNGSEWIPAPPIGNSETPKTTELKVQDSAVAGDINVTNETNIHQSVDAEVVRVALEGVSSLLDVKSQGDGDMFLDGWIVRKDSPGKKPEFRENIAISPRISEVKQTYDQFLSNLSEFHFHLVIPKPLWEAKRWTETWIEFQHHQSKVLDDGARGKHFDGQGDFKIKSNLGGIVGETWELEYYYYTSDISKVTLILESLLAKDTYTLSQIKWKDADNEKSIEEYHLEYKQAIANQDALVQIFTYIFYAICGLIGWFWVGPMIFGY